MVKTAAIYHMTFTPGHWIKHHRHIFYYLKKKNGLVSVPHSLCLDVLFKPFTFSLPIPKSIRIKQVYWFFRVNTFLLSLNCFSGLKPADAPKYLPLRNDFKLLWLKSGKDKHVEINKSINGDWMKLEGMFIKSWLKILFTFFLLSLYKLFFWLYDTSLKMMIVGGAW